MWFVAPLFTCVGAWAWSGMGRGPLCVAQESGPAWAEYAGDEAVGDACELDHEYAMTFAGESWPVIKAEYKNNNLLPSRTTLARSDVAIIR